MQRFGKELNALLQKHQASWELKKELFAFLNTNIEICTVQKSVTNEMLRTIHDLQRFQEYELRSVGFQYAEGIVKNDLIKTEVVNEEFYQIRKHTLLILKP